MDWYSRIYGALSASYNGSILNEASWEKQVSIVDISFNIANWMSRVSYTNFVTMIELRIDMRYKPTNDDVPKKLSCLIWEEKKMQNWKHHASKYFNVLDFSSSQWIDLHPHNGSVHIGHHKALTYIGSESH